jgi:hypothetical protein
MNAATLAPMRARFVKGKVRLGMLSRRGIMAAG